MCYNTIKQYKLAINDCKAAIRINPNFQKTYKRLFKAYLAIGNIEDAKAALDQAITLNPQDATNKKDSEALETVEHQASMIEKFGRDEQDTDYARAVGYCTSILQNCPASIHHAALKCEYLLRAHQLKEASQFSNECMKNPDMMHNPLIKAWRGRIMVYCGNENMGKQMLASAIQDDPDLKEAVKAMKTIKTASIKKEEASALFKENKLLEAMIKFDECLALDPLNLNYNATILLNKSIALVK